MPAGRPTDYTPEIIEKTKTYLELGYGEEEKVRSIAGLAMFLEVARSTIYEWIGQEDKKEFSDIVSKILTRQEFQLINGGLDNKLNPSIAKLMLTKHGYADKQETDVTTGGEKITDTISKEQQSALLTLLNDKASTGESN